MSYPPQDSSTSASPAYTDATSQQQGFDFREYWRLFRERIWVFLAVWLLVFGAALVYTLTATPIYTAAASVEILRDDPNVLGSYGGDQDLDMQQVLSMEDFYTQVNVLESSNIIQAVASRLKDEELQRFMEPYEDVVRLSGPLTPTEVLAAHRRIVPIRSSRTVLVTYSHPDPELAARIAGLFVEEFKDRNLRLIVDSSLDAVDALRIRTEQQQEQVELLESKLAAFRKQHDTVSFDERADIDHQELANLNEIFTENKRILDEAYAQWVMVQQYRQEGRDLWDLPVIGNMPQVSKLLSELAENKVTVAVLQRRYRAKHPTMIQAVQSLEQTERELDKAVASAVEKIYAGYKSARDYFVATEERLKEKERAILELGRVKVDYNSIDRELEVAKVIYQGILQRLEVEVAQSNMKRSNVRIIDPPARPLRPSSPNHVLNVAMGLIGGAGAGVALVFLLAFLDDRVKGTADVEGRHRLNLLCLVPTVRRLDSFRLARLVENNADLRAAEAFRSLYSSIRISDVGKDAKVLIVTSTVPSEGKSFVAANLALSFATHGERTLLIDADFRIPALAALFRIEKEVKANGGGLLGYFKGEAQWEGMIVKEVAPGVDVLASVERADSPSEMANSNQLLDIINVLREHYDRVVIDTPPLGIVSDTLALVPAVDACIYVIRHKGVRGRAVSASLRRLREARMPILGTVINQVGKNGAAYYNDLYHSDYQKYYGAYLGSAQKQGFPTQKATEKKSDA